MYHNQSNSQLSDNRFEDIVGTWLYVLHTDTTCKFACMTPNLATSSSISMLSHDNHVRMFYL